MALVRCMSTELESGGLTHRRTSSGGRHLEADALRHIELRCAGRHGAGADDCGTPTSSSSPRSYARRAVADEAPRPHRLSRCSSPRALNKDAAFRRTVSLVALSVVATAGLFLLSLLILASAGPTAKAQLEAELPGNRHGRISHLLAEGLSSAASKLDPDAVEEYAPPRGYIRKALVATRDQLSRREEEAMRLQAFYDAELAMLHAELEQRRKAFEEQLLRQDAVLEEVFGDADDIPRPESREPGRTSRKLFS